ncbi:MAG: DUF1015 domain-containing protein [Deltaproteobacteria bacterium]|nr:DUF1015 domain-containing protein [Deltaproteobacteria bacterium]MBI3296371.1 DUF1015 domain-containing protein [Deltaproteobacteria bacterium]
MLIHPIRGIHFNPRAIDPADVVIPPYDAIAKDKEAVYLKRSPYNFAHIILPNPQDPDYAAAATRLGHWKGSGILTEDTKASYYLYRQTFLIGSHSHTRDTLMCAVALHEFKDGVVRPHENTYQKYRSDRLKILRNTRHQLSHVFGMVKDKRGVLAEMFERWCFEKPVLSATSDDGVAHQLWKVDGDIHSAALNTFFEGNPIYIVDGHHRYGSSLEYAKEVGALGDDKKPAGQMLFCISNVFDPALIVFPTHRMLKTIDEAQWEKSISGLTQYPLTHDALKEFVNTPQLQPKFALYHNGQLTLCAPKNASSQNGEWGKSVAQLAVAWSDWEMLPALGINDANRSEAVFYERDIEQAWAMKNKFPATVFHAPVPVERVCDVADEGKFMPQKTTYFYPKLAAGLVIRSIA